MMLVLVGRIMSYFHALKLEGESAIPFRAFVTNVGVVSNHYCLSVTTVQPGTMINHSSDKAIVRLMYELMSERFLRLMSFIGDHLNEMTMMGEGIL